MQIKIIRRKPKLSNWHESNDWHKWFAWYPVYVHDYFHTGRWPPLTPVAIAWMEPVWRRYKCRENGDLTPVHVVARYPRNRRATPIPGKVR